MTYKKLLTLLLIGFITACNLTAQSYKFGEISKLELAATSDAKFPEADAVVLYRDVVSYLGNYVEVHERIKIFNEEGYHNATIRIPYLDVKKLKGAIYNLVDNEIVKTTLDKDLIFTDEEIKGVKIKKFTFPNVAPGAIIEFRYESSKGTMANIDLQYDIPIRKEKIKITNRSNIGIEILQNPRAFLHLTRLEESSSTIFLVNDVAALEPEPYVYDMDVYRSFLKMNLTAIGDRFKIGNWESLAAVIDGVDHFSLGVRPKGFYKDEVAAAVNGEIDDLKQARAIYSMLRDKVKWNDDYGFLPDQSIRETFKDGEGSICEINVLLVSMLRSVGLEAYPIFVSTKRNGIPLTASGSAFNSILATVDIGGKTLILDAAHNKSNFDYVASHFLNWKGMRMDPKNNNYDWIFLSNTNVSVKNTLGSVSFDEDLMATGDVRERHAGYFGILKSAEIKDLGESKLETILALDKEGLEYTDIKVDDSKESIIDVSFHFEYDNAVDEIDGKLYFSPLLIMGLPKNPFLSEERKYSIDFDFLLKEQVMMNVEIPEGYIVESIPSPGKIALPDDMGSFVYRISTVGKNIQVSTVFEINMPVMPYDRYQSLKEFYKVRMDMEVEKVVLTKA